MGHANAEGFAAAVSNQEIGLHQALSWHLTANHFPPLPGAYFAVAQEAIQRANDGLWDDDIDLPQDVIDSGVVPRVARSADDGLVITVSQAVEIMHLAPFITWEDED